MSLQIHLKLDGIAGESTRKNHKDEIELLSWNWGAENAQAGKSGSGSGAGKAVAHELGFVHRYDKASPLLAKHCASGKRIASATLSARKAGEGQQDFLKITLKDVLVSSVMIDGDDDGIGESVLLAFAAINIDYKPQDAKGGLGAGIGFDWNLKTNKIA